MKTNSIIYLMALLFTAFISCQKDKGFSDMDITPDLEYGTGGDINEDNSKTPEDLFLGNGNVPSSHDISQYLPPIGDQGNYGTCVAWALGYNLKTVLEAQDKGYNTNDLSDPGKRFSAKDLFLSIDKIPVETLLTTSVR